MNIPKDIAGKKNEIARRYAWHERRRNFSPWQVRQAELRKLFRLRYGPTTTNDVDELIFNELGDNWSFGSQQLGDYLRLTLEERDLLKIKTIRLGDRTPQEAENLYANRKRERQRLYARERRAKQRTTPKISVRAVTVLLALTISWQSIAALAEKIKAAPCFRSVKRVNTRQRAVRRALTELSSLIDTKITPGLRGFPTFYVRRK